MEDLTEVHAKCTWAYVSSTQAAVPITVSLLAVVLFRIRREEGKHKDACHTIK